MSISKTTQIVPDLLPAGRFAAAMEAAMISTGLIEKGELHPVNVTRVLPDGSSQELSGVPFAQLDAICDLSENGMSVQSSEGPTGPNWHYLAFYGGQPASIHTDAPTAGVGDQMVQSFLTASGLKLYIPPSRNPEPTHPPSSPETPTAAEPAPPTTPSSLRSDLRLRAFLSYRFGMPENEAAAAAIQRLLELENVEVLTGRSYEPRPLHEKVADRLAGVDFLVLLIALDGESPWTRDEISTARNLGALVVPIVIDGATFAPGLFGDLEYITVAPGHVGDAFIPLLEALTYIRRRRP